MQTEKTEVYFLPFLKKRLEKEIDFLAERLNEKVKQENAKLRLEIALLKAENRALSNRLIGLKSVK